MCEQKYIAIAIRSQAVIKDHNFHSIKSPQGSHLSPLLFKLFMNDVVNCFKFRKCLFFADDLKLFKSVKSFRDASELQRDLDTLSFWCQANCL